MAVVVGVVVCRLMREINTEAGGWVDGCSESGVENATHARPLGSFFCLGFPPLEVRVWVFRRAEALRAKLIFSGTPARCLVRTWHVACGCHRCAVRIGVRLVAHVSRNCSAGVPAPFVRIFALLLLWIAEWGDALATLRAPLETARGYVWEEFLKPGSR